MIGRGFALAASICGVMALGGCGEKPQSIGSGRADGQPFEGTGKAFAAGGWKAGDRTSWEQQLKTRAQQGQNDYSKAN